MDWSQCLWFSSTYASRKVAAHAPRATWGLPWLRSMREGNTTCDTTRPSRSLPAPSLRSETSRKPNSRGNLAFPLTTCLRLRPQSRPSARVRSSPGAQGTSSPWSCELPKQPRLSCPRFSGGSRRCGERTPNLRQAPTGCLRRVTDLRPRPRVSVTHNQQPCTDRRLRRETTAQTLDARSEHLVPQTNELAWRDNNVNQK